jgi:hypothetical protein
MKQEVSVHDRGNQRSYWRSPQPGSIKQGRRLWDHAQRAFERAFGAAKAAEMRQMMDAAAEVPLET